MCLKQPEPEPETQLVYWGTTRKQNIYQKNLFLSIDDRQKPRKGQTRNTPFPCPAIRPQTTEHTQQESRNSPPKKAFDDTLG